MVGSAESVARVERTVLDHVRGSGTAAALAPALARWQQRRIPAYGRFCAGLEPRELTDIPSAPVALLKHVRFCITTQPGAVFRTSGTTSGARGEHALASTRVYDEAARLWFEACVPDCPTEHTISLVTDSDQHPDSSLGHMVSSFAPDKRSFFDLARGVDTRGAWQALAGATEPTWLPTTAFALAELLRAPGSVRLPAGSVLMVTGGFKGRSSSLDEQALLDAARGRLGVERVVREYGMTELSSQLWDTGRGYRAPPWLHVYAVDPVTAEPVEGVGLLRFVDCANWSSCLAIETEDLGVVCGDRVDLAGRLKGAPARGCSLSVEEATGWTSG